MTERNWHDDIIDAASPWLGENMHAVVTRSDAGHLYCGRARTYKGRAYAWKMAIAAENLHLCEAAFVVGRYPTEDVLYAGPDMILHRRRTVPRRSSVKTREASEHESPAPA